MRYLTTREEMQNIDAYSINTIGIPGLVLMEKAALSMATEVMERFSLDHSILIVTERGNNGGDGLALGRMLVEKGYDVDLYEIGGVPKASDSYVTQRMILENLKIPVLNDIPEKEYDVIVDGIFGVGLKREVKGMQKEVIEKLNRMKGYKIAVDVPSGVDAGSGQVLGTAFHADLTITFGLNKIGLILYPGASFSGEVCVKDIGFPKCAVDQIGPAAFTYDSTDLSLLPERKPWSNKGMYGKVLMIAGNKGMSGAAYLSTHAAYDCGSGLVRVFTCEENRMILQSQIPEAIFTGYTDEKEAIDLLASSLSWASVIGFGPGLGSGEFPEKLLEYVLEHGKAPIVIDADGINALSRMMQTNIHIRDKVKEYSYGMIFTPHLMEMSRLCGKTVSQIKENLIESAKEMADPLHIFVLKDARTIVSDGSREVYINTSGNHGMSVGGSGDVLTGIICGLLAGGLEPLEAARMGVYCHGLAGDEGAKKKGYYGLLARDIIEGIPKVIR